LEGNEVMTIKYVAYYRVSTKRQGISGLGLEAQRKAVTDWLNGGVHELIGDFTEVESGRKADRPELMKALALCKKQKATLVIAVLDRLARNVAFISNLMESGVKFTAVDRPRASPFELHIYAAMAEEEARKVGERTKAALAVTKRKIEEQGSYVTTRGRVITRLGPPDPIQSAAQAREGATRRAERLTQNVIPVIEHLKSNGITTLEAIAAALNARGIKTSRGCEWQATQVRRVLLRQCAVEVD
jgi:DNA invertase Pin-like site-specific DNA recombinase